MVLGKKVAIFNGNGAEIRPLEKGSKGPDFWSTLNNCKDSFRLLSILCDNEFSERDEACTHW